MKVAAYVAEASDAYPLHIAAKHYARDDDDAVVSDGRGVTLIIGHAAGMHKECWEPILDRLLSESADSGSGLVVKDAWSIDSPNHGQSAILNYEALRTKWLDAFPWDEYGRAIDHVLRTLGPSRISLDHLWAMGHSMGAVALIWLHDSPSPIIFKGFILVEPMIVPVGIDNPYFAKYVFPATYQRRDVWTSRAAALQDFKAAKGYATWDRAIIDSFIAHALRPHPAFDLEPGSFKGVTLSCTRFHEAACYRGGNELAPNIAKPLSAISRIIPVHLIWGEREDSFPHLFKSALIDQNGGNLRPASVSWVKNTGHLAVQCNPTGTTEAILSIFARPNGDHLELGSKL